MGPVMVVVTADRKLLAYQMHPEPKEWQPFQSQLKQQIRNRFKYFTDHKISWNLRVVPARIHFIF